MKKKSKIIIFIKNNKTISMLTFLASIIILVYTISMDCNELWHNAGKQFEILYQLALSILASFLFYIMQVYIPERKKKQAVRPYIIRILKKITDDMDELFKQLSKCYLKREVSIAEITKEQLETIMKNYSARDESDIQVCGELRNLSNAEMIELVFNDIENYIDVLINKYIGFMDEESEILIRDIMNCNLRQLFSTNGNRIGYLFGVKGISGNAALYSFKKFKWLYQRLVEYIEK